MIVVSAEARLSVVVFSAQFTTARSGLSTHHSFGGVPAHVLRQLCRFTENFACTMARRDTDILYEGRVRSLGEDDRCS